VLLQDPNDLLFRISLALHRLVLSKGQTPIHSGSIQGGNVNLGPQVVFLGLPIPPLTDKETSQISQTHQ